MREPQVVIASLVRACLGEELLGDDESEGESVATAGFKHSWFRIRGLVDGLAKPEEGLERAGLV